MKETIKIFCPPKKRPKPKTKKITMAFAKSLFLIEYRMRYAIYIPPNTRDLAINQTMVAYGNRQNATAFAPANNFDLLRSLKHLMETRLYAPCHRCGSKDPDPSKTKEANFL